MRFKIQKRLAAGILKCSKKKIAFDKDRLSDIKEAITKADIKSLIGGRAISKKAGNCVSRTRARVQLRQKRKGRRQGHGSRKGKITSRLSKKEKWIKTVRAQRNLLKELRNKEIISKSNYQMLYRKSKGGFFRSRRHIKMYIEEHKLAKNKVL
ncbi:50S ribosomal protein L19e [Candidatus Woesearchaeota archaeon]|nr:50S ribosomal protein L19e [Candidatus Woesearchaeota archaeon]